MSLIGIVFIIYLAILLGIGIRSFRYNKTQEDYLLAGRSLGPWVTAFSERASGESAWLLLALPGAAIAIGLGEFWSVIGIVIGIISSWLLIAKKIRQETEKYNALTIPDYFHKKYEDESNIIRLFSTAIIAFFFAFAYAFSVVDSYSTVATNININRTFNIHDITARRIRCVVAIYRVAEFQLCYPALKLTNDRIALQHLLLVLLLQLMP